MSLLYYFERKSDAVELTSRFCVIDDKSLCPLEIVVLSKTIFTVSEKNAIINLVKEEEDFRTVHFFSLSQLGIGTWKECILNQATSAGAFYKVDGQIKDILLIWIAIFCDEKATWQKQKVVEYVSDKYGLTSNKELIEYFLKYIKNNKLSFSINNIVSKEIIMMMPIGTIRRCFALLNQFFRKCLRKILLRILTIKSFFHRTFDQKKFISRLVADNVLGDKYEVLEMRGSSSSAFIRITEEDSVYLVKGNELPIYNSVANEIAAQLALQKAFPDEDWYLPMKKYDELKQWIKYPYVELSTLAEIKEVRYLNKSEIELLGAFLIKCVGKLNSIHLVHNDFRPDNIFVHINSEGLIDDCLLYDFGCSVINGIGPWGNNFWGRYLSLCVCGGYRYSRYIVNDAASALLIYIEFGGEKDDEVFQFLSGMMGSGEEYYDILKTEK